MTCISSFKTGLSDEPRQSLPPRVGPYDWHRTSTTVHQTVVKRKVSPAKAGWIVELTSWSYQLNIVFVIIVLAKRKGSRQTTAWLEESDTKIQLRYSLHNEWTHCNDIFLLLNAQAQILYVSKSTLNELVWKVLWSWRWHAPRIVCSYMSLPCCYCQHVVTVNMSCVLCSMQLYVTVILLMSEWLVSPIVCSYALTVNERALGLYKAVRWFSG